MKPILRSTNNKDRVPSPLHQYNFGVLYYGSTGQISSNLLTLFGREKGVMESDFFSQVAKGEILINEDNRCLKTDI